MLNIKVNEIPLENYTGDFLNVHFSEVAKASNCEALNSDYFEILFKDNIEKFENLYRKKINNSKSIANIKYMDAKGDCMEGFFLYGKEIPKLDKYSFGAFVDLKDLSVTKLLKIGAENHEIIYTKKIDDSVETNFNLSLNDIILIIDGEGQIKCRVLTGIIDEDDKIFVKTKYKYKNKIIESETKNDIANVVGRLFYIDC